MFTIVRSFTVLAIGPIIIVLEEETLVPFEEVAVCQP